MQPSMKAHLKALLPWGPTLPCEACRTHCMQNLVKCFNLPHIPISSLGTDLLGEASLNAARKQGLLLLPGHKCKLTSHPLLGPLPWAFQVLDANLRDQHVSGCDIWASPSHCLFSFCSLCPCLYHYASARVQNSWRTENVAFLLNLFLSN